MTVFDTIYTPVQPGATGTRPAELVRALTASGVVAQKTNFVYHGSSPATKGWNQASRLAPGVTVVNAGTAACFSPVFSSTAHDSCAWLDFYDDWSIAPDVNMLYRQRAARAYRNVSRGRFAGLITCNSPYLARKLGLSFENIVPNGVDPVLASLPHRGDETPRLILQGHFFRGRTDFALLRRIASSRVFEEVVICSPGESSHMRAILQELTVHSGINLRCFDWLSDEQLSGLVGTQTIAAIPHIVSDYTLSQDLMKAYKFSALGLRIIAPRLLWPETLDISHAFLTDFGLPLETALSDWLVGTRNLDMAERERIVSTHSWRSRAAAIERGLRKYAP